MGSIRSIRRTQSVDGHDRRILRLVYDDGDPNGYMSRTAVVAAAAAAGLGCRRRVTALVDDLVERDLLHPRPGDASELGLTGEAHDILFNERPGPRMRGRFFRPKDRDARA